MTFDQFLERIFAWIPNIGLVIAGILLFTYLLARHYDRKKKHRSVLQLLIVLLYKTARFATALAAGVDRGYAGYRRGLAETRFEIENERALGGPLLGKNTAATALNQVIWDSGPPKASQAS
jgi:hypothetical protein